ncbi:MAG: sulfite exporter TauE/SafE family protein [Promethearchaeota archaeon]
MYELTWQTIIILILLSIIMITLATMAGSGGGPFLIPILVIFLGIPFCEARDTATFILLFSAGFGFLNYLKQGRVNIKLAVIYALFAMVGGFLCQIFMTLVYIPDVMLTFIFCLVLFITSLNIFYKAYQDKQQKNFDEHIDEGFKLSEVDFRRDLEKGIPIFILAGFTAYLIGIGGGILFGPALLIIFAFPVHYATGMSTAIVFFTAIFNTILKGFYGQINYLVGIIIAIGSIIGATLGAKLSHRMPKTALKIFIGVILIIISINMLLSMEMIGYI